jgi:hypothetical protein
MSARRRDEQGAVMVVTAVASIVMMVIVGLVVDLGQIRVDKRTNKGVTDMAARAGIARLQFGPWSGVCKAREFLLRNADGFSSFDTGSETWSNGAAQVIATNPCPAVANAPDATQCSAAVPSTWAKLQATAGGGRFTVEIQSGYVLPDPRFPADASRGDPGTVCDNLAVILTESASPAFAQVGGGGSTAVGVRSVGRLNATETLDFVAALQLLERTNCDVLQVGGANTRVIAQPYGTYPGTIQIDSDGTGACAKPILNAQATSGGPSVLACSANSTNPDCRPGTGTRPSRIGIYAANFNKPAGIIATAFPSTYGDTAATGSPRTSRKYIDQRYRQNVADLDANAKSVLTTSNSLPPGCTLVLLNSCTGNGTTWLVLGGLDCGTLGIFFAVPGRTSAQHIWFNCDLTVNTPLTLTAANAYIVIRGNLTVSSTFSILDPRKVYVGGQSTGNKVGLDVTGGTLNMNAAGNSLCSARSGAGYSNRFVIGNGTFKVGSGGFARMCQSFLYLASGYDRVPSTNGTNPCTCSTWNAPGLINISSGSSVDWSAPNEITGRLPGAEELATTNPFEDLALWTEAGGNSHSMSGGASTRMAGVFFMPNANSFNLAGGGSLPIDLSAQFVATSLKVTGGATVNLVPNPLDSIPVTIYTTLLVR